MNRAPPVEKQIPTIFIQENTSSFSMSEIKSVHMTCEGVYAAAFTGFRYISPIRKNRLFINRKNAASNRSLTCSHVTANLPLIPAKIKNIKAAPNSRYITNDIGLRCPFSPIFAYRFPYPQINWAEINDIIAANT